MDVLSSGSSGLVRSGWLCAKLQWAWKRVKNARCGMKHLAFRRLTQLTTEPQAKCMCGFYMDIEF